MVRFWTRVTSFEGGSGAREVSDKSQGGSTLHVSRQLLVDELLDELLGVAQVAQLEGDGLTIRRTTQRVWCLGPDEAALWNIVLQAS